MRLIALLLSLLAASSASAKGYRRVQLRNKDNDQCLYAQALRLEGTDPLPNTPADTRECTSYGNPSGLWDVNTGVSGKIKSSSFAQVIYADPSSPFDGYNMVTAQSPRAGSGLQQ
ncbi:hypothetical protein I302_105527 [Kwoniella bestiolae CBS 10118]|uniref:Uncharacterized protein n=1 Tax=Kwoniella bestiolae CBS 10118 TaxID=1296100 RepID=A0A1B9FTD3_9TREE|nr:hypothetical protein I302_08810 [Kwoniella bestiolae CBS 10118]OCF22029.1 hypothetical protein I302_08810 [Kwoniella bestiolae CBS 10118]